MTKLLNKVCLVSFFLSFFLLFVFPFSMSCQLLVLQRVIV